MLRILAEKLEWKEEESLTIAGIKGLAEGSIIGLAIIGLGTIVDVAVGMIIRRG